MALMKWLRGGENSLVNQELHDGYIWFCSDSRCMYIDHQDELGNVTRSKLSADFADRLRYIQDGETVELDPSVIATVDGTVKKAKQVNISDLGTYTNKTIGDLQEDIDAWMEGNLIVGAMFIAKGNWPIVWNSGASAAISDGRTYTATVIAAYQNINYFQLMISTYGTKEVFFVAKESGVWRDIVKNAFQDDIDTLQTEMDEQLMNKLSVQNPSATGAFTISGNGPGVKMYSQKNSDGEQAYGRVFKNASGTADYGLHIRDYSYGGETEDNYTSLIVNDTLATSDKVYLQIKDNGVTNNYNIYGEHNKPTPADIGAAPTDHMHNMNNLTGHCIELNRDASISNYGGLLDFHFNGSTADYTSRIIENANGTLSINGVKCTSNGVTCSSLDITNGAQKNKSSGYVKLNNGIILQWGTISGLANGSTKWVTFPIAFPTSVGGAPMLTGNYGNSFGYELHANDVAATGFTIVKKGGSSTTATDTVSWLVVGW